VTARPAVNAAAPSRPAPPRREAEPQRATPEEAPSTSASAAPTLDLWRRRLARAERTLSSYLETTRYPPDCRPLAEHPDQGSPHHVGPLTLPLARKDGKLTNARVTLRQDRLYLVGDERAALSLVCNDGEGPASCEITAAAAVVPPDVPGASGRAPVPITFTRAEGDTLATLFQPSGAGFGGYRGPIRIAVDLGVAGETGGASFDLVYSPSSPAVFTGQVREALSGGSLALDVELQVDQPGRYVIAARADDAEGRSFAYLTENVELGAGRQTVALRLFGKLIRAEGARAPFRLRDLEGFRLLEDAYPDRDLMPAREGLVYTTKAYALRDFSDAEWESEEKARHVEELSRDVTDARRHQEGG
jgi:hypothetical protein